MAKRISLQFAFLFVFALLGDNRTVQGQGATEKKPVQMRVLVPDGKAALTIQNTLTKQGGEKRVFISPPIDSDQNYVYNLSVTWNPNNYTSITRTRRVSVKAGDDVEVDLRQADDKYPDRIQVIFVPTPDEVVEDMCKLGKVSKNDVVYDLGCGDGRMVIIAAKQFAAKKGVGIDIDPERVKESKENVKKAGVEDRVEIRQGDVLDIKDLADADVVLLYMGDDLNLRLRPILQKTLKPGSRIISHRFTMGDWKPAETKVVMDNYGGEYEIHLWIVGKDTKE